MQPCALFLGNQKLYNVPRRTYVISNINLCSYCEPYMMHTARGSEEDTCPPVCCFVYEFLRSDRLLQQSACNDHQVANCYNNIITISLIAAKLYAHVLNYNLFATHYIQSSYHIFVYKVNKLLLCSYRITFKRVTNVYFEEY